MSSETDHTTRAQANAAGPHPVEAHAEPAELLTQTALTVTAVLTRLAAEHDLSLTQLRVLGILRDRTPRILELADYLGLEKSTISGLVDRAERRGLVARAADARDARATVVAMTPAGHALSERVLRDLRAALAPLVGRLGDEDWHVLAGLLARLLAAPEPSAASTSSSKPDQP